MSAVTTPVTALTCDGYKTVCGVQFQKPWKAARTREIARLEGWRVRPFRDRQLDLCPECAQRYRDDPPERATAHGGRPKGVSRNGGTR